MAALSALFPRGLGVIEEAVVVSVLCCGEREIGVRCVVSKNMHMSRQLAVALGWAPTCGTKVAIDGSILDTMITDVHRRDAPETCGQLLKR